ncbi:insect pheromone-binding family, a10/OS-D domain-containing protein [Phthorimaea operculella]|nr:insect pheromone-binding family, a10/OS-D domain-containing protein [Phthorimaea operculella]
MKLLVLVSLCCTVAVVWGRPGTLYTDKFDHINVDEILESQRLLRGYIDCLMERGRCTADSKTLKETLPDALEHDCNKCTKKQKESSDKVIRFLVNKRPDLWKELSAKYDPEDKYQEKYKDRIQAAKAKN